MSIRVFSRYFRGFADLSVELDGINFILGDNSSGKSSLLHLIDAVLRDNLSSLPSLNEDFGVSAYDYFSPMFPGKDVILGFTKEEEESSFTKIVTVSKRPGKPPQVTRCSYQIGNFFISLQLQNSEFLRRSIKEFDVENFDPIAAHCLNDGFEKAESRTPDNLLIETPVALLIFFSLDQLASPDDDDFKQKVSSLVFGAKLPSSSFIGPLRSLPEKYYDQTRRISPIGLHFASMWASIPDRDAKSYFGQISRFGRESGLFEKVWVEPISKIVEESPLLVHVTRNGHDFLLNQVGVGVSQIAPVLTEAIFASARKGRRVALFQQPELHLHPVAQAALGSFFEKLCKDGLTAFLETHSNYLIDRFRADRRSRKKQKEPCKARVLFCISKADGNHLVECSISKSGTIDNVPEAYYDFFINESIRTML